jgi:hypothetical protein
VNEVIDSRQNTIKNDLIRRGVKIESITLLPGRYDAWPTTKIIILQNDGLNMPTKEEMRIY